MVDAYLGEIRLFGGGYVPEGWNACDGTLLPVSGNEALYSLLGNIYGGTANVNFAVPDLRGRVPIHFGKGPGLMTHALASTGGTETVTLLQADYPSHSHSFQASTQAGTTPTPGTTVTLATANVPWAQYSPATAGIQTLPFSPQAVSTVGGSGAHANLMPGTVITYIIAITGLYPQH